MTLEEYIKPINDYNKLDIGYKIIKYDYLGQKVEEFKSVFKDYKKYFNRIKKKDLKKEVILVASYCHLEDLYISIELEPKEEK